MKNLLMIILILASPSLLAQGQRQYHSQSYELLSGVRKGKEAQTFWDKKYNKRNYVFGKKPATFLARNYSYIPNGSRVLDMGMGEGRNAVFLALKGYKVTGVDISSVAVKKARRLAREFGVRINAVVASMDQYKVPPGSFDAIICFYYIDRNLHEKMMKWLRPGGILMYEAYTSNQIKVKGFEKYEKKYLLNRGELLHMFPGMTVLKYEEPLHQGEFTSSIILQKPTK